MTASTAVRAWAPDTSLPERIADVDWLAVESDLDDQGASVVPSLLSAVESASLASLYDRDDLFRSRVVMARHGFGRGEYKYFHYPLPAAVATLRKELYPRLVSIANQWQRDLGIDRRFPDRYEAFARCCGVAGQVQPTPLLLRYDENDYNCLHQDVYGGQHVFPMQVAILLSDPNEDFTGGEFVMTEQRPRMQSRPLVLPLRRGDAVVFAVHHRPVKGARGYYRVNLRHGVSRVRSGRRHTLGIIFHDAPAA